MFYWWKKCVCVCERETEKRSSKKLKRLSWAELFWGDAALGTKLYPALHSTSDWMEMSWSWANPFWCANKDLQNLFFKESSNKEASSKKIKHPIIEEECPLKQPAAGALKRTTLLYKTHHSEQLQQTTLTLTLNSNRKNFSKISFLRKL